MGRTSVLEAGCKTGTLKSEHLNISMYWKCHVFDLPDYLVIPGATTKTIAQTADTTPADGISRFCGGVFGADDSTSTVAAYGSSSTEPGTLCSKFSSKT